MSDALNRYLKDKAHIEDKDFELLKPYFKPMDVQKGTILLHPGDICTQLLFVSNGCLRSYTLDAKGKEYIVQFAPENWWISDLKSFLNEEPATYYIDAIENTHVVIFPRALYMQLNTVLPSVYTLFQSLLQNNNLATQKRLISSLSSSAEERYLEFMATHPSLALRLPQHMIASYLGIAPESLSRVRKKVSTRPDKG